MKNLAVCFIALILMFSCKNENTEKTENTKESKENEVVEDKKNEDYFTLTLDAIVKNNDEFSLFYLEGEQNSITKENSLTVNVAGNNLEQSIVIQLQEDVLPTRLIFKYGKNLTSQSIQIKGARLNYNGDEIVISDQNFFQFFIPNSNIVYNRETYIASSKEVNGKHEPVFYSRKILEDKLDYTFY